MRDARSLLGRSVLEPLKIRISRTCLKIITVEDSAIVTESPSPLCFLPSEVGPRCYGIKAAQPTPSVRPRVSSGTVQVVLTFQPLYHRV